MPHIPKVCCVPCQREMRPMQNGAIVEMLAGDAPYYKVAGDVFRCPECGATVVTRFARAPLVEAHEPRYRDLYRSDLQVRL